MKQFEIDIQHQDAIGYAMKATDESGTETYGNDENINSTKRF